MRRSDWIDHDYYTYMLLQNAQAADELETELPNFIERYMGEQFKSLGAQVKLFLQPLTDIHLHSHLEFEISSNGDIRYVYLFLIIALFVLILACINFMNLSTARSATRSKEVGMRKVVGANRSQLIRQFMGESILLALVALLFATVLIEVSLPAFNAFTQRRIGIGLRGKLERIVSPAQCCLICRTALWNLPRLIPLGFSASRGTKKHAEAGVENIRFPQNTRRVSICHFDYSHHWNSRYLSSIGLHQKQETGLQ